MKKGHDLSIRNDFSGNAPIFYGAEQPKVSPQHSGDFIGDLESGGSCSVPIVSCNIHCNGTHTECISHIKDSKFKIGEVQRILGSMWKNLTDEEKQPFMNKSLKEKLVKTSIHH